MEAEAICSKCGHACHCADTNNPHKECEECLSSEGLNCPICNCQPPPEE